MIKSKFGTFQFVGQFIMSGLLIFLIALFYPVFFGKRPVPMFSFEGLIFFLLTIIIPIYMVVQMKLSYKTTIIDTALKTISFKMFIFPITQTYPLNYFDGYVETLIKDKYGKYQCFYLVKDNKLKYKMSGRFYSNMDELQHGLSILEYKGFIEYSSLLSIKIAMGDEVLE